MSKDLTQKDGFLASLENTEDFAIVGPIRVTFGYRRCDVLTSLLRWA